MRDRNTTINEHEVAHIQELKPTMSMEYESLDDRWELLENDEENFKDENERSKCKEDFLEGKKIYTSILISTRKVLSMPRVSIPSTTPSVSTSPSGRPPKTMNTLKPKEPMNEGMNLEEAKQWFKSYRAHLTYNASTLAKQGINVQRAMLEVTLDPRMASALWL